MNKIYTLNELFGSLTISFAELSRRSGVSEITLRKIRGGASVSLASVNKSLKAFSEIYARELTPENVEGFHVLAGRYGSRKVDGIAPPGEGNR